MATYSIIKKGGGFHDEDMEEREMDPTGVTRIAKISIYHSEYFICGLTVYFERNGTTHCTDRWGGSADTMTEVNLKTNEYITSVNGYVDRYNCANICLVRSLVLKTNLDVYGPYGHQYGESFEFPALGGQIIGFHAYCTKDTKVNALGVYVRQLDGTIIKKGPFLGGSGGIVKRMHPTGITRITKISIYHSDKIHGLTVYFERDGTTQCTGLWGGNEGTLDEINLKRNEYIKFVKGYQDSYDMLKSLVLGTNLGVYGPYGKEEGIPFEHTSLQDQIIGFFACIRNNYVFRVGVYVLQGPISKSLPCGGNGGLARDMHQTSAVSRIVKVNIRHGDTIDALSICYKFQDDKTESTPLWGGKTGALTKIDFEEDEYIKSMRGYVGYFSDIFIVRSLQLRTNLKSYGPYGKEEGTPFELSAFDGKIIGFHGRSGAYLDAIGVYVQWSGNHMYL